MSARRVSIAIGCAMMIIVSVGVRASEPAFARFPAATWRVTRGHVTPAAAGGARVTEPTVRAVAPGSDGSAARLRFVYRGPSATEAKLASGELRRQIGLKLRAQDGCNLVYVMWRIGSTSGAAGKIVVSVKRNPGARTHRECGARGYRNVASIVAPGVVSGVAPGVASGVAPSVVPGVASGVAPGVVSGVAPSVVSGIVPSVGYGAVAVPGVGYGVASGAAASPLPAGAAHVLTATITGRALTVLADGALAWSGELDADAASLRGPAGWRSDNGDFDVAFEAISGAENGGSEDED